jgi:hypothetical protein
VADDPTGEEVDVTIAGVTMQVKTGNFTRDTSLASGTQAITGVGFQPKVIIFFGGEGSTDEMSWGWSDGTSHTAWASDGANYGPRTGAAIADLQNSSIDMYEGSVQSMDADGFTISWTKTGSPTGTININYLALR